MKPLEVGLYMRWDGAERRGAPLITASICIKGHTNYSSFIDSTDHTGVCTTSVDSTCLTKLLGLVTHIAGSDYTDACVT